MPSAGEGVEGPSPLLAVKTKAELAAFLHVSQKKLQYLLYVLPAHKRYNSFTIDKRNGGVRTILAPSKPLKDIQRRLAVEMQKLYQPKGCVYGFVQSKGIKGNATVHQGQHWLMKVDLVDFFPTIHFGRVRGLLLAKPFELPEGVATQVARICTADGSLPQGAPTSPVISNLVCRSLDNALWALAQANRCYYTRYADDLTFSTSRRTFPKVLGHLELEDDQATVHLGDAVRSIIENADFKVNDAKPLLRRQNSRQMVTGLVVNEKVNVKREYVPSVKSMLHAWRVHGEDAAGTYFFEKVDRKNRPSGKQAPKFSDVVRPP